MIPKLLLSQKLTQTHLFYGFGAGFSSALGAVVGTAVLASAVASVFSAGATLVKEQVQ